MSDLISRQAAIDILEERIFANGYSNTALISELNRSIGYLMRLPSAQPELHGVCNNCLFGNICRFKAGLGEYGFCSQWKPQEEGDE